MRDTNVMAAVRQRANSTSRVAPEQRPTMLRTAARIATWIWAVVSGVNFVVWLMVSGISGSADTPWWLWELLPGGVVVAGLWIACRSADATGRPQTGIEESTDESWQW